MRKMHGFSMLELVIVILVVAILAVMPFYNWPGKVINLDAQAKLFADDIRYTQALAMSKTDRYRIVKSSLTSYQILNSAGASLQFPSGNTTETLNSGLSFGAWTNITNNLIAFDGRGTPYLDTSTPGTALVFGTTYSIVITGGSNTKTITISPTTGRVVVQ